MEEIYLLGLIMFINGALHLVDIIGTVKGIKEYKKILYNPEELELNYHKYFFKWFGLFYGTLITASISLSIIIILTTLAFYESLYHTGFLTGILLATAFYTYVRISNKDVKNKFIYKKKYLKELLENQSK